MIIRHFAENLILNNVQLIQRISIALFVLVFIAIYIEEWDNIASFIKQAGLIALIAELSEEPLGLEIAELAIVETSSPDLDLVIEDLDLSERPRNCLKRGQINTIGELLEKTLDDLLSITNFGQKSLDEVIQKLDERGLALKGMTPTSLI